jgi:hypothetical protein
MPAEDGVGGEQSRNRRQKLATESLAFLRQRSHNKRSRSQITLFPSGISLMIFATAR